MEELEGNERTSGFTKKIPEKDMQNIEKHRWTAAHIFLFYLQASDNTWDLMRRSPLSMATMFKLIIYTSRLHANEIVSKLVFIPIKMVIDVQTIDMTSL